MVRIYNQRAKPKGVLIMKLTGIIKDKVDKVETMEYKKDIIAEAGMELSDDELENVSGGRGGMQLMKIQCSCGAINSVDVSRSEFVCYHCGKKHELKG